MRRQNLAYAYALVAAVLWSTVATAFKVSLRHLEPVQLLAGASIVSTLILAGVLTAQGKFRSAFSGTPRQYLRSALLGLVNPFAYYLVLFQAYDLLPAQEAQPLNYTWGLVLPLLAIPMLKQRVRMTDLAALVLGYAGVVVIATHGHPFSLRFSHPGGVALALGSAFLWALYWIYNVRDDREPVVCLFLSFLFSLPAVIVVCLAVSAPVVTTAGLLGVVWVGAFEMSVTFVVWLSALRLSRQAARVSMLIFVSPFLSLVFIHFALGEHILPSTFSGLVLIVCGLVLQRYAAMRGERSLQRSAEDP